MNARLLCRRHLFASMIIVGLLSLSDYYYYNRATHIAGDYYYYYYNRCVTIAVISIMYVSEFVVVFRFIIGVVQSSWQRVVRFGDISTMLPPNREDLRHPFCMAGGFRADFGMIYHDSSRSVARI